MANSMQCFMDPAEDSGGTQSVSNIHNRSTTLAIGGFLLCLLILAAIVSCAVQRNRLKGLSNYILLILEIIS